MARGKKAAVDAGPVEGLWELPEGWRWERLGDCLPLEYGRALSAKHRVGGGDVPVFGSSGNVGTHDRPLTMGPTIVVGRKGSAGAVHYSEVGCWPIDTAYFVRPRPGMDLRFSYHLLRHLRLGSLDQSTAIPSLGRDVYSEVVAPVPGEAAQIAIAGRIDSLFAEIDEGEAALAEARAGVETYRKSLLKAAVTGELTADWRRENPPRETGTELLQRILAERRARWEADPKNARKKYVEPVGPDMDGLTELPEGWVWASVAQLGPVVTGGTPPSTDKSAFIGDIPFFTPTDLNPGYGLLSTARKISQGALSNLRPVPAYSVLVTCIGATIGKTGLSLVAGATNQQINAICIDDPLLADYVFAYFDGPVGKALVIDSASATTLPILNKGDFSRLRVPLPPKDEVRQISRLLASHRASQPAEALSTIETLDLASALRQSILAAAFRGELTT